MDEGGAFIVAVIIVAFIVVAFIALALARVARGMRHACRPMRSAKCALPHCSRCVERGARSTCQSVPVAVASLSTGCSFAMRMSHDALSV